MILYKSLYDAAQNDYLLLLKLKTVVLYFYVILIFHELTDHKHLNSSVLTLASLFHVFRSCTSYLHHSLCMNANVNLSEWENLNSYRVIHTFSAWRLQVVSCEHAPARLGRCLWNRSGSSNQKRPASHRRWSEPPRPAARPLWQDRWSVDSSCPLPPASSPPENSFVLGQVALAVGPKRWRQNKWNISGRK